MPTHRALSDEADAGSSKESAAQQRFSDASRPNVVGRRARASARKPVPTFRADALGALVLLAAAAALPFPATARPAGLGLTLECVNVRRLSDNFLLDLRIRLQFDAARARYVRFENSGRGWQVVGTHAVAGQTPTRIVLGDDVTAISYIERLTGDYYLIDHTGTVQSVWARCARTHPLSRPF